MNDDLILSALKALAECDRAATASPELEANLRVAFRRRQRARLRERAGIWSAALMAAAAIVILLVASHRTRPEPATVRVPAERVESPVAPMPVRTAPRRMARARAVPSREIVTEFFPLLDGAPPFERGELIRVNVPAAAMRTVGLPVGEDRLADQVQADVLVGQEGLPRAIRFVKSSE